MNCPKNILVHSRSMLIEQVMALVGHSNPNPPAFRSKLEAAPDEVLRLYHEILTEESEPSAPLRLCVEFPTQN